MTLEEGLIKIEDLINEITALSNDELCFDLLESMIESATEALDAREEDLER